jgi:DMSO/TMAO reductase YedYZ molybdopterin-dependent catalytic subunit
MQLASLAALAGLLIHYGCFYLFGTPLLTEAIAEYIMAETPSRYAVAILSRLGEWAKPSAMTGGLATLGALLWVLRFRWWAGLAGVAALIYLLEYRSPVGLLSFWLPAVALLFDRRTAPALRERRGFLLSASMMAGTAAVAAESFLRNRAMAARAVEPVEMASFRPPVETGRFAPPLVRKAVTPVNEFYAMSKNAVDPAIDPTTWRLRILDDDRLISEYSYAELLALPREDRYVTLRCISNTLQSNLMGNAQWSGIRLRQIVERSRISAGATEMAVIGVDGHGDSFPLEYAWGDEVLLALGMNGRTLDRTHGFPLRLLVPRYYGFKHIKWIGEIRFVRDPYFGTWPKKGYTKDPAVHTVCYIDRVMRGEGGLLAGGIAFAGSRGIKRVQVRADGGEWVEAECETPLSRFAWTRWRVVIPVMNATRVEARAMDKSGRWQADRETPLFPNGVAGPTQRSVSL